MSNKEVETIKVYLAQYANHYADPNDLADAAVEEFHIARDVYNINPTWLIELAKDACETAALDQIELDALEK